MCDFYAGDCFDEVYSYIEDNMEITEWEDFVSEYLKKADNTKPYCVAGLIPMSIEPEEEGKVFTQAAFLLYLYHGYKDGGLESVVEDFVSGSDAETYEELIEECDRQDFSFKGYLRDSRYDSGFSFLVQDDYTVKNDYDKSDVEKCVKQCKGKIKVDNDLKAISERYYGKSDTDWIFKDC